MIGRYATVALLFALANCAAGRGPDAKTVACQVTLTASKPKATCTAPAAAFAKAPRLVELPITKIENPSAQSFSVFLYASAGNAEPESIGNVTVYPPDRTGVFVLRSQAAFDRLSASRVAPRITIEIRPTLPGQPWQPITVVIGPLRWLYEEPK